MKSCLKIIKVENHWTREEKLKCCGYGEWLDESDLFEFEYLDYHARVIRILTREPFATEEAYFGGHLCGYVRIPESHPFFRKKDIDLDCHGGVTFNEANEEHWVGFDCGHSGDKVPTMEHIRKTNPELKKIIEKMLTLFPKYDFFKTKYRNIDYCIENCIIMINELIRCDLFCTYTQKNFIQTQ